MVVGNQQLRLRVADAAHLYANVRIELPCEAATHIIHSRVVPRWFVDRRLEASRLTFCRSPSWISAVTFFATRKVSIFGRQEEKCSDTVYGSGSNSDLSITVAAEEHETLLDVVVNTNNNVTFVRP